MKSRTACFALGWLLGASASLASEAPELFADVKADSPRYARPDYGRAARMGRYRLARVNTAALVSPEKRIRLNLFPEVVFDAVESRSHESSDHSTWIWRGRIEGMSHGTAVIAASAGMVSVNISTDTGTSYQVRQVDGEIHAIQELVIFANHAIDDTPAPPEPLSADSPKALERAAAVAPKNAAGDTVIDILVAYTPSAQTAAGGAAAIQNRIELAMAEANQTFVNSAIGIEMRLVHKMLVNYNEQGIGTDLYALRTVNDGLMDEVHAARDTYGADLVSLWINGAGSNGGTVGMGYQMSAVSSSFASSAFSVIEQNWAQAPAFSFVHEFGHNMGAQHERGASSLYGAFDYSHGRLYQGVMNSFSTIMASNGCGCANIAHWSNPNVNWMSSPTGIPSGDPNSADNALTLNNTKATVASFRDPGSSPGCTYTLTPGTANVSSNSGSGSVAITTGAGCSWTASSPVAWITLNGATSGTGNGALSYSHALNASTSPRTGTIAIAGQTFYLNQAGADSATVPITITSIPAGLSLTVDGQGITTPQSFSWTPGAAHTLTAALSHTAAGTRSQFISWNDGGAASHPITVPSAPATYTATFSAQFQLSASASPTAGGYVSANPTSPDGYYDANTVVQLSASNSGGYQFGNWSGAVTGTGNPVFVTMSAPRTVTANFTSNTATNPVTINTVPAGLNITVDGVTAPAPQVFSWTTGSVHTISAPATQGGTPTRQQFAGWSDGGAASHSVTVAAGSSTYTASYQTQHLLTTSVAGGGQIGASPTSADGFYNSGASVQLTALPAPDNLFSGWGGAVTGNTTPMTIVMDAPKSVSANFTAAAGTTTITSNPPGLTITVDGAGLTTPQSFQWQPGTNHTITAPTTQGGGSSRNAFVSWSNGGSASQTVTAGSGQSTYTAAYQTQHLLTTASSGSGTIAPSPASVDGFHNHGASVQLTATPSSGGQFTGWSGAVTGSTNPVTIVMDAPKSVSAAFSAGGTNVTVTSIPAGRTVTIDGTAYTTPQSFSWGPGTSHSLSAATQGNDSTRYLFQSWSNGGGATQFIITEGVPVTYTATFTAQHRLTTAVSGTGAVAASPASGDGFHSQGTSVQVTATPSAGSQFTGWSGAATGNANPVAIVMDGPKSVTASFGAQTGTTAITIATAPAGLTVLVDGAGVTTPQVFQWTPGSTHTIGVAGPQGNSQTRQVFATWSDGGAASHSVTTPQSPTTYAASFTTQYALTTLISPIGAGSITITPFNQDGFYNAGANVQLTAAPIQNRQFANWSGDLSGAANPAVVPMNGTRAITANFTSASSCGFTLNQPDASVASTGDLRKIVLTGSSSCSWTASSNAAWARITDGASGSGNGVIRYSVEANIGATQRSSALTIAGQVYTITQPANGCSFQLASPGSNLPAAGGSFQIGITTSAGCQWTVSGAGSWLTFTSPAAGTSSGTLHFLASQNSGSTQRTALITVGGQALHFVQSPASPVQVFADVATNHLFSDYVSILKNAAVPDLCGANLYCPETNISRSSMAIFLVRTLVGDTFTHTAAPYFTDVPATHPQFRYIQKLRDLGVTNGCGNNRYCPDDAVTRGQMAAFVVRAKLGIRYDQTFPYQSAGPFNDTATGNLFFAYVQKLRELGVTTGCTATTFCPDDLNTRGQMGAFLSRGFY